MIQWLMRLVGIEPKVTRDRRRSLIARLKEPQAVENGVVGGAQVTLARQELREQAIEVHQAKSEEAEATCKAERHKHRSEIQESTLQLARTVKRATREIATRRASPNPFLASEMVRKDAERRGGLES